MGVMDYILGFVYLAIVVIFFLIIAMIAVFIRQSSRKGSYIFIGAMIILIVGSIIFFSQRRKNILEHFGNYLSEYKEICNTQNRIENGAYIRGKIVPIDIKQSKIHELLFNLPGEVRARKPEDVKTILLIERILTKVGRYSDGQDAYEITWRIKLIDTTIPAIVAEKDFFGSDAPKWTRGARHAGSEPEDDVLEYLKGLPHRE